MGFSENLQNLRKMKNMSQEQLAEKLDVSRQAVSKWESGNGYPETEKLILICEFFDCSMDVLLKGKISDNTTSEKKEYENLKNKFSKGIALAVGIILLGVTIMLSFFGFSENINNSIIQERYEVIGVTVLLLCVLIAVPIFIVLGIQEENFRKKNVKLSYFYSEDEIEKFNQKFPIALALAVALILIGVILLIFLYGMKFVNEESILPVVILMFCVTIAVPIFIYFGIQKEKFDIEKYNGYNSEDEKKKDEIIGRVSGVIMLIATIIFLLTGFIYNMWHINWLVYPICGILCGIVGTIFGRD